MKTTNKWNGKKVMTLKEVDGSFNKPKDTAKHVFMLHRAELTENKDYIYVTRREYADRFSPNEKLTGNPKAKMILLYESGLKKLIPYISAIKDADPLPEAEPIDRNDSSEATDITTLGVFERDRRILVSSRDVARCFEKEHDKVMRDITSLNCSLEFSTANFGESEYLSDRGRTYKEYLMTRDGFVILAMGYTGKKAMRFKEAYIAAFNEMEHKLQETASSVSVEITESVLTDIERLKIGDAISRCSEYNLFALLDVLSPYISRGTIEFYRNKAYKKAAQRTTLQVQVSADLNKNVSIGMMK